MQQRLPSLIDEPIAFAHRGARAHAPENTLEAFALGLRLGATGLESDVWLTADGIAVLDFHRQERRLEEVFVDVLKGNATGASLQPPPLPGPGLS